MKLKLKQKLFVLFRQKYNILDDEDKLAFYIKPLFSFVPKFEIYDSNDNLIFVVKKKLFRLLKKYEILNTEKEVVYAIKQKFSPFVPKARIIAKTAGINLTVDGNILAHEFDICENDSIRATVSKKYISLTDSYVLDIFDEQNAGLYIAVAMVYDAIYFNNKKRNLFFK